SKYKLVAPNDIVYNKMRMWQGAVGVSNDRGIVSPAYIVLKPRGDINHRYYHFLLRTPGYIEESHRNSYGICDDQLSLRYEDFKGMQNIIPPKDEQDQIVRYLDSKLSKANKFINTKKKQIELLQELKQAIINKAVTKGLAPTAKMKPSGIEWLGDIPEGWEVRKLSRMSKIVLSGLDKKTYENQKNIKICNYVDVYKNDYITNDLDFMIATATDREIERYTLLKNDIIITKDSELWNDIAVPSFVDEDLLKVLCGYHLAIIRLNSSQTVADFIYRAFLSDYVSNQYKTKAKGVTRFGLSYQDIHDTIILLPPTEQQQKIASYIRIKSLEIDAAVQKIKKEINLISEYRTSLISDVVTGKVDVRHVEVEETFEEVEQDFNDLEEYAGEELVEKEDEVYVN
ncbi:MAG: restriction endonuclease subunit S, partial [Proteiniphilum sp.]|nr:restriction endonuclease subunit S [Proteiniphilum sp.]